MLFLHLRLKKTLTVNATPDNALIIFTDKPSNVVIAQGTGTLTYELMTRVIS